jgi:iron-sulfur cluster assembly protein/iron-sulfur cluster insertion protein
MTNDISAPDNLISLTEPAAHEVRAMLAKPENANKHLRLYVEKGGCSGMQYGMTFDEVRDGDAHVELHGVKILVDGFSADYLRGTQVDFSDALNGGGFKLVNPNAKQSCGCGKSFET